MSSVVRRGFGLLDRHRSFSVVLVIGLVVRALTEAAYWPAISFSDSGDYLANAQTLRPGPFHPIGYPVLLWIVQWTRQPAVLTLLQHLLGVGAGVLMYLTIRRIGAAKGWATLAAAPLLLDPLGVYVEQIVLSDTLFVFLMVALLAVVTLRRPSKSVVLLSSLLLVAATLVRTIALVFVLPLALSWLARGVGWRRIAIGGIAVAVPLLGYAAAFDATNHAFALQGYSGRWLYGRVAGIADCSRDDVPASTRELCPAGPPSSRPGPSEYAWDKRLPYYTATRLPSDPVARSAAASRFARAVILHEPRRYLSVVVRDLARVFAPGREAGSRGWFTGSWRFYLPGQPPLWREQPMRTGFFGAPVHPHVDLALARALHRYERVISVPGPLAAAALVVAVAGGLVARRRRIGLTALGFATTGVLLLVVPILTVDLDYRYVLGAEELIIPAGALGAAVLAAQARARLAVRTRQPLAGIVAAVVLAGSLAGNLVAEQAYAGGSFTPVADGVVGTPLRLHNRAVVSVGPPAAGSTCDSRAGSTGAPTGPWRLTFDVHARWRSGPSLLMTTDDFYLRSASGVVLPSVHVSHRFGLLVPVMIGPAVREAAGRIEFTVTEPPSKLIYIDPLGAGSLQWTLSRSAVEPTPALAGC